MVQPETSPFSLRRRTSLTVNMQAYARAVNVCLWPTADIREVLGDGLEKEVD